VEVLDVDPNDRKTALHPLLNAQGWTTRPSLWKLLEKGWRCRGRRRKPCQGWQSAKL